MPGCGCGGHGNMPFENNPYANLPYENKPNPNMPYPNMAYPNMEHPNMAYPNMPNPNMPHENMMADFNPHMHMMNIPQQFFPMVNMPQAELENMYPQIYYKVNPAVEHYCNIMGIHPGTAFTPTHEQLNSMVEGIAQNVEGQMDMDDGMMGEMESRQPFFGGFGGGFGRRRFLRNLITILLIRELLRRRRRPFFRDYDGYYGY